MKLSYTFRLPLVVANALFVLLLVFHIPVALYAALFTGLYLFLYYVTKPYRSLGMSGATFNFIGVLAGGLTYTDALIVLAIMGSIFMLGDIITNRQD